MMQGANIGKMIVKVAEPPEESAVWAAADYLLPPGITPLWNPHGIPVGIHGISAL